MPIPGQTTHDGLLKYLAAFIAVTVFSVVVQMPALSNCALAEAPDPSHVRTYHDESNVVPMGQEESDNNNPWGKLPSMKGNIQLQVAANLFRRSAPSLKQRTMLQTDEERPPGHKTRSQQELEALISFKDTISGDPLAAFTSWSPNDSSACGWVGIMCSSDTHRHHVISIDVSRRQLVGSINSALVSLRRLRFIQRLDLSANAFSGTMSGASLANLSSLTFLNVSYNQVTGEIPLQIGELANLETLDFERNNLTGDIPTTVSNCTLLKTLNLGSNFLRGPIPQELGRLTRLESLNLGTYVPENPVVGGNWPPHGNSFSGSIPSSLSNCSALTYLNLQYNPNLEGKLPPELDQLRILQSLLLQQCKLGGTLPSWIGNLTELREFKLSYNQFQGSLPSRVGQLRHLRVLSLGGNRLTGVIPQSIFNCTMLTSLGVEDNMISGTVPSQLGSLQSLKTLSFEENNFTGVIPSSLANCSSLEDFRFGDNSLMDRQVIPSWISSFPNLSYIYLPLMNLFGQIPLDLGKLAKLEVLDFYQNDLTDVIPSSLGNCTLLRVFSVGANNLSGQVPTEIGLLPNVENLLLFENSFTGSLPAAITNMTKLEVLGVFSNAFDGAIDVEWGRLSQLQTFRFENNHFYGPLPRTLSDCTKLLYMDLSGNDLTDEIPPSFGNLSRLQRLSVANNRISGQIPVDITRWSTLGFLDLSANMLEGPLPSNMGGLFSLQSLNLSHNKLEGDLGSSLSNLSHLINVDLSYNQFSGNVLGLSISATTMSLNISHNSFFGSLPSHWSGMEVLQDVDISANAITGSITSLSNFKGLMRLDVSSNNFSGDIPGSLASLPYLTFFNGSYNDFEGAIPTFNNSLITAASFLGNPRLCGVILGPTGLCLPQSSISSREPCKGLTCKHIWIPILSVGVGTAFLVAAAVLFYWTRVRVPAKVRKKGDLLILTFDPSLKFSSSDVFRIIKGSGGPIIGFGGRSIVYKGSLPGGQIVAVKSFLGCNEDMDGKSDDGWRDQLVEEAKIQASLRHRNILKVLSLCSSPDVKVVILEYMPQGCLHDHLHPSQGGTCQLSWQVRLRIACEIAQGMKYIHHDCPDPLIHGDLKPGNVLLDAHLVAKVADFGISKFINPNTDGEAPASSVFGTFGYMPPEYLLGTSVSTKGDVYSYGIVLLELLTGRQPTGADFGLTGHYRGWILESFQEYFELLDQTLQKESEADPIKSQQMMFVLRIALFCTRERPQTRPSMENVLSMLMRVRDLGSEIVTRRTTEELANGIDNLGVVYGIGTWAHQDPNDANLPSLLLSHR